MFGIPYDVWIRTCNAYIKSNEKYGRARSCLQWYPFYIMNDSNKRFITSKNYYEHCINNGAIVHLPAFWITARNYILKDNGSLREMNLVSPHLFLILECFGRIVHSIDRNVHSAEIHTYYAGNYNTDEPYYSNSYHHYTKDINKYRSGGYIFIKTDVSNFYQSINVNKMFEMIENLDSDDTISDEQLMIFKELLLVSGNGKYPTVEKSTVLSYLATSIYLFDIDEVLAQYIREIESIMDFHLIRYVDDLYIVYKSRYYRKDMNNKVSQNIIHMYSSLLSEYGLSINMEKTKVIDVKQLDNVLSHSNYDSCIYEVTEPNSEECFDSFLETILNCEKPMRRDEYNSAICKSFSTDEVVKTASFRLNNYIYSDDTVISKTNIKKLHSLLNHDGSILSLDPKRLVSIVTKTNNESLIKQMLSILYDMGRSKEWNRYYLNASTTYLLNRGFVAKDLIKLFHNSPDLEYYCKIFCNTQTVHLSFYDEYTDQIQKALPDDVVLYFLYAMYKSEQKMSNTTTYFAYYATYFERISRLIRKKIDNVDISERIKQGKIASLFDIKCDGKCNDCMDVCIIHELIMKRNSNPIIHSGAEMLTGEMKTSIDKMINETTKLAKNKINNLSDDS